MWLHPDMKKQRFAVRLIQLPLQTRIASGFLLQPYVSKIATETSYNKPNAAS